MGKNKEKKTKKANKSENKSNIPVGATVWRWCDFGGNIIPGATFGIAKAFIVGADGELRPL